VTDRIDVALTEYNRAIDDYTSIGRWAWGLAVTFGTGVLFNRAEGKADAPSDADRGRPGNILVDDRRRRVFRCHRIRWVALADPYQAVRMMRAVADGLLDRGRTNEPARHAFPTRNRTSRTPP